MEGKNKPVYHPLNDTGDHVVIINSKEVIRIRTEVPIQIMKNWPRLANPSEIPVMVNNVKREEVKIILDKLN